MDIPFFVDLNPVELKCYPLMINLDKCNVRCNFISDLSMKICVPSRTKDVNVKVFHIMTNRNESKALVKYISFDC